MSSPYAASVQGVATRVCRLGANGAPTTGATASYVMPAFIRVSFTPEYEEGEEIQEKSADGNLCVYYKALDTLKRVNLEVAICEPDPEFTEILAGGTLLAATTGTASTLSSAAAAGATTIQVGANIGIGSFTIATETIYVYQVTGTVAPFTAYLQAPLTGAHTSTTAVTPVSTNIGWAAPLTGTTGNTNGCGLEVWSHAVRDSRRAPNLPYFRWVFPYVQLRPTGERAIENGLMANVFSGFGLGNSSFTDGPANDWSFVSDRAYQYAREATAPSTRGYVTVA